MDRGHAVDLAFGGVTTTAASPALLTDELLATLADRAPETDRTGEFVTADIADLARQGYLAAPVPAELGGPGRRLDELARLHRELAYHAPATALAVGMHLFWVGAAADRFRAGDESYAWVLEDALAGEVFAAGHSEPTNDLGLADSVSRAEPTSDGGYAFHGRKVFSSLSPVWTRLGVHGRDGSGPDGPRVVHAVITRDELATLPAVVSLARRARRLVVANLVIAATFIGVLATWDLVGTLPLPLGVAGHEGSTVIVGLNGLRLLRGAAWRHAGA